MQPLWDYIRLNNTKFGTQNVLLLICRCPFVCSTNYVLFSSISCPLYDHIYGIVIFHQYHFDCACPDNVVDYRISLKHYCTCCVCENSNKTITLSCSYMYNTVIEIHTKFLIYINLCNWGSFRIRIAHLLKINLV